MLSDRPLPTHLRHTLLLCVGLSASTAIASVQVVDNVAKHFPQPELFGDGVVSTGDYESHPAFTPDGQTLYFVKSSPSFDHWNIYVTHLVDGHWTPPELAPFSGRHRDADPFITSDGRQLYFISDRPVDGMPKNDMDIYVMDRSANGEWGEPRNLGAPINTDASEWFPVIVASGTLYFGSGRQGGHGNTDLYRARPNGETFGQPENLGPEINSSAEEYEGWMAADERLLVFMAAGRPDGLGAGDLYISRFKDGAWSTAKNLGRDINGPGLEISPGASPDGRYFMFSSARSVGPIPAGKRPDRPRNGLGDIYRIEMEALNELEGK
jgi:Tol biopolymer transport system component